MKAIFSSTFALFSELSKRHTGTGLVYYVDYYGVFLLVEIEEGQDLL